jgi:non-ribosomal peptide synthetase component F
MALHAGLAGLLTRLGAGTDVPVGTPVAGREHEALSGMIGFFVNTLVLRADTSGNPSFRTLLGRIRDTDLSALDHQNTPFERVVEAINPARSLSRQPLFQVMLSYQESPAPTLALAGSSTVPVPLVLPVARFDLCFTATCVPDSGGQVDRIELTAEYATELFDLSTAETLLDLYLRLLDAASGSPDRPIGDLDIPVETLPLTMSTEAEIVPETVPAPEDPPADSPGPEELMCQLFGDVLDVDHVAGNDNFFDLGGHSLLGIILINRVRSAFGTPITFKALFETPTPAGLAARLAEAAQAPARMT